MTDTSKTSTGHQMSNAAWLDVHFESARPEYEASLRSVGVQKGWTVLDAGCGAGGFLPLLAELVGEHGQVAALDLAPENIAHVESLIRDGHCPGWVRPQVGSLLALPFDDATFDCVWCANVVQYFTQADFVLVVAEFRRVLKPGGTLAIKEYDSTNMLFLPMDWSVLARFLQTRWDRQAKAETIGGDGTSIPSRLRQLGLSEIRRTGWTAERWAPVAPATRAYVTGLLASWGPAAETYDLPPDVLQVWRNAVANPATLLDDPDFCFREAFVLTVGRFPAT